MTEPSSENGVTLEKFDRDDVEVMWSPTRSKLITAMIAAELEFETVTKDAVNPHFNSKFASINGMQKATKLQLLRNGILMTGQTGWDEASGKHWVCMRANHVSGEWMGASWLMTPVKKDPQGEGSALTYARRQLTNVLLDLAAEDDDANAASIPPVQRQAPRPAAPAQPAKEPSGRKWAEEAEAICKQKVKPETRRERLLALMEECRDGFGELDADLLGKFMTMGNALKAEIEAAAAA